MSSLPQSSLIAAAVGATIGVITVAAAMVYNKILERQQHSSMNRNIDKVNRKVAELQSELEELRAQQILLQQKNRKKRIAKRQIYTEENTLSETDNVDIDTFSYTTGTDFGDDEFFDCSDDEIDPLEADNGTTNGTSEDPELLELDKENEDPNSHEVLYIKLKNLLTENSNDVEIVWRFARACYNMYNAQKDNPEKAKAYLFEGCEACEKVIHICHAKLYKWYAIMVGLKCTFLPTREKIEAGYQYQDYVLKALELDPNDCYLHHLLGRFKYELSGLSWIERKVAATLFSEVPSATFEDAIPHFETADKLGQKHHFENSLLLSKCYIAMEKYSEAIPWLKKISKCPDSNTDEETKYQIEANKLLEKYSDYCT
ncbi:hypothetical protein TKK_0010362 [Trichogramma kaykai]|uniref:Regulator of microtubule dynamics protein 1 n=1 Tax=Trichogramma kaykai TaxID=54128 RepID=A0ABD2WWR0_9HYME